MKRNQSKKLANFCFVFIFVINSNYVDLAHLNKNTMQLEQRLLASNEVENIISIIDLQTKINKLTIYENTESKKMDLFVTSRNHLYKIVDSSSEQNNAFKIDIDLSTGPKSQREKCVLMERASSSSQCQIEIICDDDTSQEKKTVIVDNDNLLLLIDPKNKHLIECGTVDYGACRLRQLSNLGVIGCNASGPVIQHHSASGFISSSSSFNSYDAKSDESSLYLMVSKGFDPNLSNFDFPVFSIRNLLTTDSQQKNSLFKIKSPTDSIFYDQNLFTSNFHMKIIYNFKHNGFVYFFYTITNILLTEQCARVDSGSTSSNSTNPKLVTRMLRVCDSKWSGNLNNQEKIMNNIFSASCSNSATFSESILDCEDQLTGLKHNLLQSAYYQPISSANSDDSILFMAFNSSFSLTQVVCKIRVKEIDNYFLTAQQNCLKGDNTFSQLKSPYFTIDNIKSCRCSLIPDSSRSAWSNDNNNYLNSHKILSVQSINFDDVKQLKLITSITSLRTDLHNKIAIIISTLNAQIYMLSYDLEANIAHKYSQINLLSAYQNSSFKTLPLSVSSASNINLAIVDTSSNDKFPQQRALFVTYDRYLYKINLQNCKQYDTCETCLNGPANPFCGWCVYKQECTLKKACSKDNSLIDSLWLAGTKPNRAQCPSITGIKPSRFFSPFNSPEYEFKLNLKLLPKLKYFCDISAESDKIKFDQRLVNAKYLVESGNLKCDLSSIKYKLLNSEFSKNEKFLNFTVQLRTESSKGITNLPIISSTNLYAFNCSYFKDCNRCLSDQLGGSCTWCSKNSQCVFTNQIKQCLNDFRHENSNTCTMLSTDSFKQSKIEIPYSADSRLSQMTGLNIKNRNLNYQQSFKCVFSSSKYLSKNQNFTVSDVIWKTDQNLDETQTPFDCIYSPYKDFTKINSNLALQTVYMSVWWSPQQNNTFDLNQEWNQIKFLNFDKFDLLNDFNVEKENENNFLQINILNCELKASSCGKCLDKELIDLGCGWCKTLSKCTMKKDCKTKNFNDWMNNLMSQTIFCSHPKITQMAPNCGPRIKAGTLLTLTGENLGNNVENVAVKMKPVKSSSSSNSLNEDIDCKVIRESFNPSSQIACRTDPLNYDSSNQNDAIEYSVYVITNNRSGEADYSSFDQSNQFIFKYATPVIVSIEPRKGIKSGGTLLTITGKHLSCGSELSIKFTNFSTSCLIENNGSNINENPLDYDIVYCRTKEYHLTEGKAESNIKIKMDDYEQSLNDSFKFEYVEDPKITSIEPDRTILSGGLLMSIHGTDFGSIQTTNLIMSTTPLNNHLSHIGSNEDYIYNEDFTNINIYKKECNVINSTLIECYLPEIKDKRMTKLTRRQFVEYSIYIQFNEIQHKYSNQLSGNLQQLQKLQIYQDPLFEEDQMFSNRIQIISIQGQNLLQGARQSDYKVLIGDFAECKIAFITMNNLTCFLPDLKSLSNNISSNTANNNNTNDQIFTIRKRRDLFQSLSSSSKSYQVRVYVGGTFNKIIGHVKYENDAIEMKFIVFAAGLISTILVTTMVVFFIILKHRQSKQIRQLKRMQTEFENLEMRVARECKEAFTELQMDIGELANTLHQTGAPFHDFQTYSMKILFPNASETEKYYMTTLIDLRLSSANKENVKNGVLMFSQLILNKKFLLTFIHTLEADTHTFLLQDRINLASYLSICLHDRLDYFTDILMTLLAELIEKIIETKNNPKILFRRNESIAEKMLTNWFAFLLYDFIKDCAGTPLYILFLSIKQQIYKGPVDAISCEARYSLSEDKLIRQSIDYETITIRVQLQDFDDAMHELTVKVLNCDTITQVKEKILDSFFKGFPFSKRPHIDDLDLIYIPSEWNKSGRLILFDEDKTCKIDNDDFKRINTLAHYKITNGSLLVLVSRQSYHLLHSSVNDACNSYTMLDTNKNSENMTLLSKSSKGSSSPPTYSKLSTNGSNEYNSGGVYSAMNGSSLGLTEYLFNPNNSSRVNQNNSHVQLINGSNTNNKTISSSVAANNKKIKNYHLIKMNDSIHSTTPSIDDKKQDIAAKLVSEVYLTRLLATKGGMQSYVDDFFETIFSTAHGSNVLPFAIKYFFDFLDEQANIHGITDPDVVYTWKSNSLPLRFWVNIIKNPDFVFDIFKSNIVDASLSVIASTFMDSCSQSKLDLNKESPSGKLLFYKEVHKYRKWVESYYSEIKMMPKVDDLDMSEMLAEESKKHNGTFNKNNAMYKLYNDYIKKYRVKIENSLNDENQEPQIVSINKHLNYRLQQVIYLMDAIEV